MADGPGERAATIRDAIAAALRDAALTAPEISGQVGIAEREVADHLGHLERSLPHRGERLEQEPPRCMECGFVFEDRSRHTRPGRCPRCKKRRTTRPRFRVRAVQSPKK